MELEVELKKAKDEVLRKIGRNMLFFQQVEHMLKYLIANGQASGITSELKANQKQRAKSVQKQTMGMLAAQYLDEIHLGRAKDTEGQAGLKEAYFSFSFKVDYDSDYYETRKQALASIVDDRNDLIHHLLPKFNPHSIESCMEVDQYLDQQREKHLPEIDILKRMIETLQEGRKELGEFLLSEEGKKHFKLQWLRQSRLVMLLVETATQVVRPDGWAVLDAADHLIRQHAPDEISALHERYGHKTLKGLMLATDLFDLCEESTDRGGIRVLYRLKPDAHFNE